MLTALDPKETYMVTCTGRLSPQEPMFAPVEQVAFHAREKPIAIGLTFPD